VPDEWPTGFYRIVMSAPASASRLRPGEAFFVVRSPRPGRDKWEWPFVQWAEREGIALEYATNEDLERNPDLLSSYRLVVSVGHDEYWSVGMRNAFESYIHKGGMPRSSAATSVIDRSCWI
jgi:hypothetical protein